MIQKQIKLVLNVETIYVGMVRGKLTKELIPKFTENIYKNLSSLAKGVENESLLNPELKSKLQ